MGGRDKFKRRAPKASSRATPVVVEPKPKRNHPCSCGSGNKYKHCHGAPPKPLCSVKECDEPVRFFLSPSVDGERSDSQYWLSCEGHVQDISAGAARHGMDVDVIPFDSIDGQIIAKGGMDVVHEPILPAGMEAA